MYSFKIKADASDIDIPVVRSLLVFAAIIIAISRNQHLYSLNIVACFALVIAAFIAEVILVKYKLHSLLVVGVAALLLAICTFNIIFPLSMIAIAVAVRYFYVQPGVVVNEDGISIKKTFSNNTFAWGHFNQVVLKDGVLSLDYSNNKVLQLELETNIDEKTFNEFCTQRLLKQN